MEEDKEDWKESWIGWPSKNKSKDTPEPEVKDTPEPEVKDTPEPEVKDTPKPEVKDTPKPEVKDTPEPEVKDTPKPEVKDTPEKAQDFLNKLKSEEGNLGSSIYENFAIFFGVTLVILGFILLFSDYGILLGIAMIVSGIFTYVSISWFARVLKGLEQNNNYLKKILKERKI